MTPILTTRNFSVSNVSESIACSKVGQKRDCQMKRFCVAALIALTRSTDSCSGDEDDQDSATGCARSTCCAHVCRSVSILAEARIHLVWRPDRPDRDHAKRAGREEKMDQSVALFARIELLHAPARSGSAATRDLHWLASAQDLGRNRRGLLLCSSLDLRALDTELHLCGVWKFAGDRRHFFPLKTGGDGDRSRRGDSHWPQGTQERSYVDAGCARFRGDLFSQSAISRDPVWR